LTQLVPCTELSSMAPLQSLSAPSHTSSLGTPALQPTHPTSGSQVSTPKQVPMAFASVQARFWPAFAALHPQEPVTGAQRSPPPSTG
jgi:hypothetical protein